MDEFSSNTNARSAGGHAAYGMKIGEDNRWINIQLNTFTNWVNEQLKKVSLSVRDFRTDFCDGIKLCALIEVLQQKQLKGVNKKPANQHQYLENVVLALRAMVNDDIKLVNIGGEDIVNGNLKLIMGLVWRLILRYQISRGKASPKKFMLAWVNSCIEDYEVTNFTTDWNDGLLLHALLEYCRPGTSPNWRQLNKREGLKNCRTAMELAKHLFDIPLVVRPENMASRELDELSAMTYLSYFTRLGSPGYNSTLRWVQEQIPQKNVSNFQMDWNDGSVVVALVESLGGKVNVATPRGHVPSNKDHVATLQIAMTVAKQQLGVEPVVTAKDMADPAVGHLGVMAYAASFQRASLSEPPPVDIRASLAHSREQLSSNFLRPASSSAAADLLDVQLETALYTEMYPVRFSVDAVEGGVDKSQVHVEVHGATTRPSVTVHWKGNRAVCEFLPTESGTYKIYVFNGRHVVRGGPWLINVAPSSHRVERMIELAPPPRMMEVAPPYVVMDNGSPYLMANGAPPFRVKEAAAPHMMTDGNPQPGLRPFSIALPSSGAFLGAQTPIGINAANVRLGNAKVEARSPSGQVHEMSISENDGAYTANFTPTEVGVWNISILYDGQHIQGSPFDVRVFDASQVKVYGLENGSVENAISFSVDSTAAGEGQLVVSVSHKGRPVPVDVDAEGSRGKYRVHFMPDGSGVYEIRVTFAGIEVPGSPFSMDILDTASVQVSGDGLSVAEVNRRARFAISTGDDGSGRHLRIILTSPRGDRVPCDVALVDDGVYEANYIPTESGEHRIDITYHGRPIANSPFYVLVTNNNRITVHNLRPTAQLGRPVEFDIDASQGGVGDMEIMINEGQVPCGVQNRGNRLFRATFTPRDALPHYIDLRFNGMDVPGSPWRVDVISPVPLTVSGPGLGSVRVNTPSYFDVSAPGTYVDPNLVLIQIMGPKERAVPHQVANSPDGGFSVQYVPVEVGSYTITVSHAGVPAFGSPHVAKAYDCAAIVVNHPRTAIIGTPVELTVDVTQAGEGQLEISVNRGTLPNSVKMLRKGVFLVTFTPQESKMHTVEIRFNSEPLPRGPVEIFVQDLNGGMGGKRSGSRSPANVLSQSQASLNHEPNPRTDVRKLPNSSGFDLSRSKVDLSQVPLADMNVRVTSPNGVLVPAKIVQQPDGDYKVEYSSKFTGRHKVEVHYNGQLIMGSPFFVEIYDPNKIRIEGHKMGVVGQPIEFDIVLNEAGQAELVLTVTSPSGLSVPYNLVPTAVGKRCTYVPQELGPHYVHITYGGLEVPGLPLTQMIVAKGQPLSTSMLSLVPPGLRQQPPPAESAQMQAAAAPHGVADVRAQGDGLIKAVVGQPAQFTVDSKDSNGELRITVEGPNSLLKNRIEQDYNAPGHYSVSYVPVEVGIHIIAITWNKATVGRPYEVNVVDPRKVSVAGGWPAILDNNRCVPLIVNELKRIEFITREAGQGDLTATVTDPHGSQLIVRIDKSPNKDRQAVEFIPRVEGEHVIMVFYAGLPLPESPLQGLARFTSSAMPSASSSTTDTLRGNYPRVALTGLGLQDAYVREMNEFVVDGTDAGPGELRVTMVGMKEDINVTVTPLGNNKYRCAYTPQHTGFYQLDVLWSGQPVRGSPYRVTVSGRGEASQVKFAADSMLSSTAGVGREVTCIVDTRRAGPGMLTALCDGPTMPAMCDLKDRHDGTFVLVVVPQETGRHVVNVMYANEHVPGSPMVLQVGEGMPDPSKVKVFGSGVEDGLLATYQSHFVCDTRGAGAGQLTVRVRGPKGAFRVEMQRESQKDRIIDCRYDPTEPGEYEVSVKWSGVDVPGSPFRVRIFNVKEQLEQFYARYPKQHSRPIGVAQHPVMGTANGSHNASFTGEE